MIKTNIASPITSLNRENLVKNFKSDVFAKTIVDSHKAVNENIFDLPSLVFLNLNHSDENENQTIKVALNLLLEFNKLIENSQLNNENNSFLSENIKKNFLTYLNGIKNENKIEYAKISNFYNKILQTNEKESRFSKSNGKKSKKKTRQAKEEKDEIINLIKQELAKYDVNITDKATFNIKKVDSIAKNITNVNVKKNIDIINKNMVTSGDLKQINNENIKFTFKIAPIKTPVVTNIKKYDLLNKNINLIENNKNAVLLSLNNLRKINSSENYDEISLNFSNIKTENNKVNEQIKNYISTAENEIKSQIISSINQFDEKKIDNFFKVINSKTFSKNVAVPTYITNETKLYNIDNSLEEKNKAFSQVMNYVANLEYNQFKNLYLQIKNRILRKKSDKLLFEKIFKNTIDNFLNKTQELIINNSNKTVFSPKIENVIKDKSTVLNVNNKNEFKIIPQNSFEVKNTYLNKKITQLNKNKIKNNFTSNYEKAADINNDIKNAFISLNGNSNYKNIFYKKFAQEYNNWEKTTNKNQNTFLQSYEIGYKNSKFYLSAENINVNQNNFKEKIYSNNLLENKNNYLNENIYNNNNSQKIINKNIYENRIETVLHKNQNNIINNTQKPVLSTNISQNYQGNNYQQLNFGGNIELIKNKIENYFNNEQVKNESEINKLYSPLIENLYTLQNNFQKALQMNIKQNSIENYYENSSYLKFAGNKNIANNQITNQQFSYSNLNNKNDASSNQNNFTNNYFYPKFFNQNTSQVKNPNFYNNSSNTNVTFKNEHNLHNNNYLNERNNFKSLIKTSPSIKNNNYNEQISYSPILRQNIKNIKNIIEQLEQFNTDKTLNINKTSVFNLSEELKNIENIINHYAENKSAFNEISIVKAVLNNYNRVDKNIVQKDNFITNIKNIKSSAKNIKLQNIIGNITSNNVLNTLSKITELKSNDEILANTVTVKPTNYKVEIHKKNPADITADQNLFAQTQNNQNLNNSNTYVTNQLNYVDLYNAPQKSNEKAFNKIDKIQTETKTILADTKNTVLKQKDAISSQKEAINSINQKLNMQENIIKQIQEKTSKENITNITKTQIKQISQFVINDLQKEIHMEKKMNGLI